MVDGGGWPGLIGVGTGLSGSFFAGWEGLLGWRAGVGESEGLLHVACDGHALEEQVSAPWDETRGVVWRRDVLGGKRDLHSV